MSDTHIPAIGELRALLTALDQPIAQAEAKLLDTGDALGQAIGILGTLTDLFAALPQGLEHAELKQAVAYIGEVIAEIALVARNLNSEQAVLDRLVALSTVVAKRIERLAKTVGAISALAINARIAAAKLDNRGEDFSVFTKEIGRLSKTAVATIEDFAAENDRLVAFLGTARANQAQFEKQHKETLGLARTRLETSLGALAERRAQMIRSAKTIGARSDNIRQGIGTVITALQIGDSTRQRLEHVAQAVEITLDEAAAPTLSAAQREALIGMVVRLQSLQTVRASDEFDSEIKLIVASLGGLVGDAEGIMRLGIELYGTEAQAGSSFLSVLGAELTDAGRLIETCAAARAEIDRIAAEAGSAMRALLERIDAVHGIEVDMRLVGLNTMLKCGRLGNDGRMLSVIAQELRSYANQTVEDAHGVTEGLKEVAAAAETLGTDREGEPSAKFAALEAKISSSAAQFTAIGTRLSHALGSLERDGKDVTALLKQTIAGIDFRDAITRRLGGIAERFDRIAAGTKDDAEDFQALREGMLDRLKRHYTMASEREIHRAFRAAAGIPETAEAPPPASAFAAHTEEALEDILF